MNSITRNQRIKHLVIALIGTLLLATSLTVQADETVTYVQTDIQGNPVTKTDSSGKVIWRQSYAPYGQTYQQADPDGPGYTGHRHDAATGLVYMQARYYDPKIGRFLSVDPVTFSPEQPDHFNLYWYANGNPIRYTDPDGRCPDTDYGCGTIFKAHVAWRLSHPNAPADGLEKASVWGVVAMVGATLAPEAAGAEGMLRAVGRYVAGKIASTVTRRAVNGTKSAVKGRAANKLRPYPDAMGVHSTFKQNADGKISNYATYRENPQNPSGFQVAKRVDITGKAHTNPDGEIVPTPHVKEGNSRYVRPARKDEIPGG